VGQPGYRTVGWPRRDELPATPGRVARPYPQAARLCTIITAIPRAIGRRGIELPLPFAIRATEF